MRSHQLAIMAAHSAVADTTSWNIILQDLESYLLTASLESRAKSHFRQWVGKSFGRDSASDQLPNNGSSSVNTRSSNTDVLEVVENTFIIDRIATDKLLNYEIHKALRTEPEDIIVASMLQASSEGNFDTILPAIHMFDSNRTSEDSELNFSGTVGCFKVLNTVSIEAAEIDSILDILRRVKDARRISIRNETKTPGANENDERSVRSGEALDIHFEYQDPIHTGTSVGSKIRLEKSRLFDCQLRSLHSKPEGTFLIDVFARPVETGLQIRCVYNPSLQIRDKIRGWFESVEHSIHSLMDEVVRSGTQYSLADFPLLPLNYNSLEALVTDRLPAIAADMDMIDEVYPCSPMQEGLLISQSVLDSGVYQHFNIVEITPRKPEATVDAARLASAWRQVVQRHSSLRTVFIESSARNGLFDQVVLKKVDPDIVMVDCAVLEADRVFKEQGALLFASGMLPHRLTICQVSADRLLIKLDINHAIIDGSSIANIVYDLVLAYEGQLPVDQAFRFSSYIQRLQQLPAQPALQFWKAYLVNLRPCLIPPLAQLEAKCVEKLAKEAQVQFNLATDVLYKFCQEANVSPASVFQAAWALVLRLYTESDDVCFGLICSGRDVALPNIEGGVGAFLNMLVHRLVLAQDMQLSELVGRTAASLVECLPHQHIGLANIQHVLDDSSIDVKNISVNDPTEYPLTLDIWFSSGRARATLRHWVDFMTPLQAESIASTFERAVHCVLANSQMTIGELELVGEHHLAKLVEFNGHSRPRSERLIFTRFEENARAKPEAPAIHGWDGSWTYTELDNITNRLAHHLRNWGVGPEVIVPHCFQKSGWAVITIMSILKAGGAFVGLDPSHPVRRLEYLVSEVNATVVCTTADNARLFVGMRNLKHLVIVQPKLIDSLPDEYGHPHTEVKPSNAACVVFTSGTTGNPKAIVIEHSSMASNSDLMGPVLKLDSSSRVFQFASYTFDVSNQDILTTLQRGGCVCIPSEDDRLNDPGAAIERLGANWANLTSTVMSLIQPATVPSLRRIFQLGEPLSREAKNLWAEKLELYNTYGPAEAAVSVTCTAPLSVESSSSNVGTAPGCSAWVVDVTDVNKLVPLDAIGELLLEGPLLARLYLKNPAKTAAAFVENPSWAQRMYPSQNRRFYRTGDLCRFNSDGTLTILGRRDTQVKINGQRVELDEIAHQIQHQLGTRALVSVDAIRIDKTSRSKALVAFIQFLDHRYEEADSDDILISVDEQRAAEFVILHHKLRKHLPKYMVPSLLIPIRHTSRTANGKLDRSKLDEIASSLSDDKLSSYKLRIGEGQDLKTDEEKLLQTLWSDVFSVSAGKISANDDFFRLGGDSVTAMNLVSAARAKGVSITVRDIFTSPLLSEMALKLRKCEENQRNEPFDLLQTSSETLKGIKDEVASQCGVPSEQVVDLYPCSPLQEGFMALSARQNGVYKAQRAFRITDKDFDWSRFKQAWAIVVKSEPILRTRIVHVNTIDRPLQAVLEEDGDVEWLEKDNLGAYLKEDREHIVSYGSVLWENAIIQDGTSCYFVWTAHHAIYDAWSTGILFDQISHAYRTGTVSTKATDFKRMIRHLSSLKDKDAKAFWLSHFPEDTGVPTCFPITPSAAQQNYWPDQSFRLTSGVVRFPGPQTISVATILRAVWALTISHYTDSNDVVFAETLSGRNAPISGVSDMNGPAITTVPVRIRINRANGTSIKQYLEAVQAQSIAMIPFEHTGLQNIKRFGANAKSVIDSLTNLFLIQPSSLSSSSGTGIDGLETVINKFEDYDSFALVIKCILDEDRSLILEAQYDKAVIQAEQIQRILQHYDFMIQHIVNASCIPCDTPVPPADTLDSIPTIDPDDFRNVKEWNKSLPRTIKACAHELIAQRVAEQPNAEAIFAWDGNYTYHQVQEATEKLSIRLQSLGVGPEIVVSLCFDKSKYAVIAMLAVLTAGGAFTQLSPTYPAARREEILSAINGNIALCSPQHESLFSSSSCCTLVVDDELLNSLHHHCGPIATNVQPHNAAIVLFTSGSTGKPKGIVVEHQNLCSMQHYQAANMGIDKLTRTFQFAANVFDNSNSDVFLTLMQGGCLCIPSEEERLNNIPAAINKYNANWCCVVRPVAESLDPNEVPTLEHLCLGGEKIGPELHSRWTGRVKLINVYGPAECTINTSSTWLQPGILSNSIGRGQGCRTWVTSKYDYNQLVPIGCVGELCVEGPIVTRGYHGESQLTARTYVTNPRFAQSLGISNLRMYRTGDLVKYAPDGSLLFMGRSDDQIKLRGQRIECSEVEFHIISSGFPADGVLVDLIYQLGDRAKPALAAFIQLDAADSTTNMSSVLKQLSASERQRLLAVQRHLRDKVQPFMVPSFLIGLQQMPLTQTGKKDRRTLREIGAQLTREQLQQYSLVGPSDSDKTALTEVTDAENELRTLWSEVLGVPVDSIHAHDHFFQLGGDSIWAMRLSSAARRIGRVLLVVDIFSHPILRDMVEYFNVAVGGTRPDHVQSPLATNSSAIAQASKKCNIKQEEIEDIYPCTPLQQNLVAVTTDKPGAYIETKMFHLPDSVDIDNFKAAWQIAADLFPILRTRIILGIDAQPLQVVVKEELPWEEFDVSVDDYLASDKLHTVEYGRPLTSFAIATKPRIFIWTVHHALYDGVSAANLLVAVERLYKQKSLQYLPIAFSRFVSYLGEVDGDASDTFWHEQLSGGSPKSFPLLPSPVYEPRPSSRYTWAFNIPKRHRSSGIRDSAILRAAWAIITARYVESDDIVFGAALSGRDSPIDGVEGIIGPTVTTVPIRVRLNSTQKVIDFLHTVQNQADSMIPYQHAGLQALRGLGPDVQAALSLKSLFVVQHSLENLHVDFFLDEVEGFGDLMTGYYDYPLVMECILGATTEGRGQSDIQITMDARFDAVVIPKKHMVRLCRQFRHVVEQLDNIEQLDTLDDIRLASRDDVDQVSSWNASQPWECVEKTVHDIISDQVRLNPNAVAITGWDGQMSYLELDERSTRVAKILVSKSIGPETVVPLCFEKSKWAVVAALAVLKAGGVVTQLGVSHPLSRKKEILEDTRAKLVLVPSTNIGDDFAGIVPTMVIDNQSTTQLLKFDTPLPEIRPSNAAYILFTSGSTGRPKGIVVEHRNLASSSFAHGRQFKINQSTRVFQFAAYTFDISCADVFTTLQRGATICIPSEYERINDLAGAVTKYQADWMFVTPTVAQLIDPDSVPSLRTLVLGGEAPTTENVNTWAKRLDLIFIWGPAETTIYASANPPATRDSSPKRLGHALGCHMWLCDPHNHDKLAPVGCVGEILVEGPIVSRGYLHDQAKTLAAYVYPIWAGKSRRMYKTGDLARYVEDGVMHFVGRKDDQVKVRGQRVEIKEIEYHMLANPSIRHAVALVPSYGPLEAKLIAVLALSNISERDVPEHEQLKPLQGEDKQAVGNQVATIRQLLEERLPSYMIPTVWICVETMALTGHGKTDRMAVAKWVENIDHEAYEDLLLDSSEYDTQVESAVAASSQSTVIRTLASQVLGIPAVPMNRSFFGLGGDSITAMQLRIKARAAGIDLSVRDILKAKSLFGMAEAATPIISGSPFPITEIDAPGAEVLDTPFRLSPIQKLFFDTAGPPPGSSTSHFNQTILLKVNRKMEVLRIHQAIHAIVSRHSMLRARFSRGNQGEWTQSLTDKVEESFTFQAERIKDRSKLYKILAERNSSFDISQGPIFAAHLFDINNESQGQLLLLSAHHLVTDVVSWLVILVDMEEFLTSSKPGLLSFEKPLSFQTWLRSQQEQQEENLVQANGLNPSLNGMQALDLTYWGITDKVNKYGSEVELSFSLDEEETARLLRGYGNKPPPATIESVDIMVATLLQAFPAVFIDHPILPTVFSEGHGRESADKDVDPSGTVGWFTTLIPLHVVSVDDNIVNTIREVQKARLQTKLLGPRFSVGRDYFGTRSTRMEILFNFLGSFQQLESKKGLFSDAPLLENEIIIDNGPELNRLALFDISAIVTGGRLKMTFKYNERMQHQNRIHEWITTTHSLLKVAVESLSNLDTSEFETYFAKPGSETKKDALSLQKQMLDNLGVDMENVQEILPCVPLQQHMVSKMAQQGGLGIYEIELAFHITGDNVNTAKLESAWQQVIDRHSILRTIIVPSDVRAGFHEQVVLAHYPANVPVITCVDKHDVVAQAQAYRSVDYQNFNRPHHQLTIFETNDGAHKACKLEISHALNDGVSTALMLRDLQQAYQGQLNKGPGPAFSSFVSWQSEEITAKSSDYWKKFARGTQAAPIPAKRAAATTHKVLAIDVCVSTAKRIRNTCLGHGVTMATFFQVVWALVLSAHTGRDDILFGYMTANRDVPLEGVGDIVGPLVNMILCRIDRSKGSLGDLLSRAQDDFLESLTHQHGLIGSILPVWNSVMSLQYLDSRVARVGNDDRLRDGGIQFEQFWGHDPNEWDITLGVQVKSGSSGNDVIHAFVGYWFDSISEEEAQKIRRSFGEAVEDLITGS
ncbi:Nonribosomal peptide synthetase [Metarhizium acridum]|uniref:Nonribosomal peptide synthetase n=1 Tax=Metarhizium acridum TaxID=92637 RepID=UPI001C6B89CC|nr:Nonribosomal peptide synthetase [Metarhizium acridum]